MSDIKPKFKTFRDAQNVSSSLSAMPSTTRSSSSASSATTSSNTSIPYQKTSAPSAKTETKTITKPTFVNETSNLDVSPVRDFQKVANSVTRAMLTGIFKGKSKLVFDYLWSVTRGAISPSRTVKKSRKEIKDGSGIGSMVTVDASIKHLEAVGLITISQSIGSLTGNQYEIFSPDEIDQRYTSSSSISSISSPTQKLDILDIPESGISSTTQTKQNIDTYGAAKTFFKDLSTIDDDLPLKSFIEALSEAAKKATGKTLSKKDIEALPELAEILIAETELARRHTKAISVYLKFAVENLRRRLYAKPKEKQYKANIASADWSQKITSNQNEGEIEMPEVEPLTEELRSNALEILRGIVKNHGIDAIMNLRSSYTEEDFDWLRNKLVA